MKRGLALTIGIAAVALLAVAAAGAKSNDTTITGAGSTFVAPLVSAWTPALGTAFGYNVQYSAGRVGCRHRGGHEPPGRLRCVRRSALPRPGDRRARVASRSRGRSRPRPSRTTSRARPVHLKLDGATIAKIFLGDITNWNDPAIATLNPGASLPNLKITPVFRSDGSGTSYNFTDYLSARQPRLEDEDRCLDPAGVPGRHRRQGLRWRRRCRLADGRRLSPTSMSRMRSRTTSGSQR